ncbi:hypothetical protein EJ08DRAFT_726633 [Tothia fuscella]|uniref:Uncharacterized protein n=1 Tax=Tothia fuscella TaxID=1048955 RepID=A0A9P4NH87_9PEZI|nr:hypothetical protein EJ08DRAFT_726633 [Tothia fuscella]
MSFKTRRVDNSLFRLWHFGRFNVYIHRIRLCLWNLGRRSTFHFRSFLLQCRSCSFSTFCRFLINSRNLQSHNLCLLLLNFSPKLASWFFPIASPMLICEAKVCFFGIVEALSHKLYSIPHQLLKCRLESYLENAAPSSLQYKVFVA